jgi:hypothetical protein
LEAHYANAIPLDLLKSEQERLTREIEAAESRLTEIEGDFKKAESNLKRALTRAGDCAAAYREAAGPLRRQFNLAFFKRLLIDDECNVWGELAEPFDALLGDDLRRAAAVQANEELQEAVEDAIRRRAAAGVFISSEQRPRGAVPALVGAGSTPRLSRRGGFSPASLVQATQVLSNQDFRASGNIVTEVTKVLASVDRARLSYVAKRLKRLRASDAQPRAITSRRLRPRRPGWVPDAVREVLAGAGPMRLMDIHAAMERQLGQPVSIESVSWCLRMGVRGLDSRFVRVARGRYALVEPQR